MFEYDPLYDPILDISIDELSELLPETANVYLFEIEYSTGDFGEKHIEADDISDAWKKFGEWASDNNYDGGENGCGGTIVAVRAEW